MQAFLVAFSLFIALLQLFDTQSSLSSIFPACMAQFALAHLLNQNYMFHKKPQSLKLT